MTSAAAKAVLKQTTGLTGVPVCEYPRYVLGIIYNKTLRVLQQHYPPECEYRKSTEALVNDRWDKVKHVMEENVSKLEEKIGMGQIEEVIIQAETELQLARTLHKTKPWEPLVEKAPEDQWKWPV